MQAERRPSLLTEVLMGPSVIQDLILFKQPKHRLWIVSICATPVAWEQLEFCSAAAGFLSTTEFLSNAVAHVDVAAMVQGLEFFVSL